MLNQAVLAAEKPTSRGVKEILDKAETFELYSLDPKPAKDVNGFHDYKVLGKTLVKDAKVREGIVAALYKGIADTDGTVAGCFNPRHGIRAGADGQTADLVICFECLSMQAYLDGKRDGGALTTGGPQTTFDKVLRDAGVPRSPK